MYKINLKEYRISTNSHLKNTCVTLVCIQPYLICKEILLIYKESSFSIQILKSQYQQNTPKLTYNYDSI